VVLLCLPIVGCNRDSWLKHLGYDRASLLKKYTPQDDQALALHSVDLLFQDRYDEIENSLDPTIRNGDTHEHLVEMSHLFPSKPISVKTVEAESSAAVIPAPPASPWSMNLRGAGSSLRS
jgi:hypothetical protein